MKSISSFLSVSLKLVRPLRLGPVFVLILLMISVAFITSKLTFTTLAVYLTTQKNLYFLFSSDPCIPLVPFLLLSFLRLYQCPSCPSTISLYCLPDPRAPSLGPSPALEPLRGLRIGEHHARPPPDWVTGFPPSCPRASSGPGGGRRRPPRYTGDAYLFAATHSWQGTARTNHRSQISAGRPGL